MASPLPAIVLRIQPTDERVRILAAMIADLADLIPAPNALMASAIVEDIAEEMKSWVEPTNSGTKKDILIPAHNVDPPPYLPTDRTTP